MMEEVDLTTPGGGMFGHSRSYGNLQTVGAVCGPNGYSWSVQQFPTASRDGSTSVQITFDQNKTYWFDQSGASYVPAFGDLDVSLTQNVAAQTLTFAQNSGGQTETTIFNSLTAATNPGQFVSRTDARGVTTTVVSQTGGQINEVQRSYVIGTDTTIESLVYTYFNSPGTILLQSVSYRTQTYATAGGPGTNWSPVRQVTYTYCAANDPYGNGNLNDLQSASQQLPGVTGGWNTVAVDYYRYWRASDSAGFAHGLKAHFGPEAYRLLFNAGIDPTTAADSVLLPYADHYFEYDSNQRVTKEISAVCPSCPGGGTTSDLFAYYPNTSYPANGFNTWSIKTVQTLPDADRGLHELCRAADVEGQRRLDTARSEHVGHVLPV